MKRQNFYAGSTLDRIGHRRIDQDWIRERLADASTRFVPVWRQRNLFLSDGLRPALVGRATLDGLADNLEGAILLGLRDDVAYFSLVLPDTVDAEAHRWSDEATRFDELRALGLQMDEADASLLAHARGMAYWHARHRFCGQCGSPTRAEEAGHVRRCTDPNCKTVHFPRTDPVVIMLVTYGDRCLLGRQAIWPKGMYSCLAGFVEPGESLEEAVAREVLEEAGVTVTDVTFHSSQPWPFPGSIMLGFQATAASLDVQVDGVELERADWFERAWLRDNLASKEFFVPPPQAIARQLIESWIAEG